jgi:hypothetical protein
VTWKQYIKSLQPWVSQLLKYSSIANIDISHPLMINSQTIHIINDGGVENASQGTFGTVITNGEQILYTSKGKCYNNQYYESAYRSECYAVLSGLVSYFHLMTYMKIPLDKERQIKIYCDNKKLIRNLHHYQKIKMTVNDHNRPDFDIISEILYIINIIKLNDVPINIYHVTSYKDDKKAQRNLDHSEKMHITCHKMAQQAKQLAKVKYIPLPHNNVNLTINDNHVNENVAKVAKKCYHSIHAR